MWDLIPEKERRMYTLVEKLYFAEKTLSLKELTQFVDSSSRSISSYIDELKVRVNKMDGTLHSLSDGYSLELPANMSIDTFQRITLRSSPSLQLLEKLFLKGESTGFDLENDLHISSSTLSRMIAQLKKCLADYGLALETRPYRIVGDEFLVRRFFTSYFLEAYGYKEWPIPSVDYIEINALIASLSKIDAVHFETVNVQKFVLFTAVSALRERSHYGLNKSNLANNPEQSKHFKRMRAYVKTWLDTLSLTADKKAFYGNIYTSYMFYYFRSYTDNAIEVDRPDHSKAIKKELCKLARSFEFPINDFSHVSVKLDDMIYQFSKTNYSKALDTYLIFMPSDYDLLRVCKERYPEFYQALLETLDRMYSLYDDVDPEKVNSNELLYLIVSRWDQLYLNLYETYTCCRILVYSPFSYQNADNIARFLQAKLERACEVTVYTEPFINEERLSHYTFDILVTTGSLDLDIEQDVIVIISKLTRSHLRPLFNSIDKAIKKNNKILSDKRKQLNKTLGEAK